MEKRRLGRTGHESTLAIFGAAALWEASPQQAEAALELARSYGVNHIDVAPSYGQAESLIGPWLSRHRSEVFLGCKTMERLEEAAWVELHASLERLRTDRFDLYQLHAIRTMDELDEATRKGGALPAILRARAEGLVRYIGITGHGYQAPAVHAAAIERLDFDTVLTPLNFIQWAEPGFRIAFERLLDLAQQRDVGVMLIKTVTRGPWGERPQTHTTWYQPFDQPDEISRCVRFALSQPVTAFATPGDLSLLPLALEAAERFRPMTAEEQAQLVESAGEYQLLFPPG